MSLHNNMAHRMISLSVGRQGDYIVFLKPPIKFLDENALYFAAYIVALLPEPIQAKFQEVLKEIKQ